MPFCNSDLFAQCPVSKCIVTSIISVDSDMQIKVDFMVAFSPKILEFYDSKYLKST